MDRQSPSPEPFDVRERLADALREQDATPAEVAAWLPLVERLAERPARDLAPAATARLVAALAPLLPAPSPVRRALRARAARPRANLSWLVELIETARTQVSVLRPSFWLVSAAVILLGLYVELGQLADVSTFALQALGPLLAFFGIGSAFRGAGLRTLEYELACPPSALQLLVARLVVVLGYDVGLGLCLSLALWLHGDASFLAVTLHWLMPLLLVAGLALALSLRLPSGMAAGVAYAAWLAILAVGYAATRVSMWTTFAMPIGAELALGAAGVALLVAALMRFPGSVAHLLPGAR